MTLFERFLVVVAVTISAQLFIMIAKLYSMS